MDKTNPVQSGDEKQKEKLQRKKPYRKPEFRFERVFETQALSCGKVGRHAGQCKLNPKSS